MPQQMNGNRRFSAVTMARATECVFSLTIPAGVNSAPGRGWYAIQFIDEEENANRRDWKNLTEQPRGSRPGRISALQSDEMLEDKSNSEPLAGEVVNAKSTGEDR